MLEWRKVPWNSPEEIILSFFLNMSLDGALGSVFVKSQPFPEEFSKETVKGYDFNEALKTGSTDYEALFGTFKNSGFQSTNVGLAIEEINKMVNFPHPL